jgi:predicted RNA methylase
MKSDMEALCDQVKKFVNSSASGLLQLLVAAAQRTTYERIIACPTYPVPARTAGLSEAVRRFHEIMLRPDVHPPTFLARLYASTCTLEHRKRAGQFFTAESVAEWALSLDPPLPIDDVCDAGAGTGVFADAILRKGSEVRSYTGIESDPTLALCCAHVLDSANAPSSFKVWYTNFLLLRDTSFRALGLKLPSFVVSNPPYVRFHNLAGRADILMSLKSSLGVELSSLSGSVSYFLLKAAELLGADNSKLINRRGDRLLFLLPKEAAGAAHARRLREDLRREYGWTWREYTIPIAQSAVDPRSNSLALLYIFEQSESPIASHVVRPEPSACLGDFVRIKRGISTGCNDFFVLTDEEVRRWKIKKHYRREVLPTRVPIKGHSFSMADWELLRKSGHKCWLLTLPNADLEEFESPIREYLRDGIRRGVHATPTAIALRSWFSIPIPARPPDVFVTYLFRGAPHFALNEAGVLHLTNILGGRFLSPIKNIRRQKMIIDLLNGQASRWIEIDKAGREYKGGLRKIEPRELSSLPVDLSDVGFTNAENQALISRAKSLFD